jgi:hypothetical protein
VRILRSIVVSLTLAALFQSSLAICDGWNESPAVRAACCDKAGCDHAAIDDCCARGETRQHAESLVPLAPVAAPVVQMLTVAAASPDAWHTLRDFEINALTARPDTYLLLSVFLV